uniref:Uncharacterized protein n=1 Tax=Phocoena sinus TaxID=42100 RepID=A0A8C9AVB9_PHOSS
KTEKHIKKMWYIYTIEYYSAIRRNKVVPFAEMWMELETVIQSEVRVITSGVSIIRVARNPYQCLLTCAMITNILCIIVAIIVIVLTVMELSSSESVSCRNYGQVKLGREISCVLLGFYPLELCTAFTYTIFGCVGLCCKNDAHTLLQRKLRVLFKNLRNVRIFLVWA